MKPRRPRRPRLAAAIWALLLSALSLTAGCSESATPPPPSPQARSTLTLVTYNILASDYQLDLREPALLKLLEGADADVIALQEVRPSFARELMRQPWARPYRQVELDDWATARGDYIFTRLPIDRARIIRLPSPEGRGCVVAWLEMDGRSLAVATSHMDSALAGGRGRAAALDTIFEAIASADDAVLMGDLNFGDDEQPETDHLNAAYLDAWKTLHPDQPGLTWDRDRSEMARDGSFPNEPSRRLDRILLRSSRWRFRKIELLGDEPIARDGDKRVHPSDHFGLRAELERTP